MSEFSSKVYSYISTIPKGRVVSYQQVAEAIGHPRSYRAVGSALNKNRSSKVPCHRVVASDGSLGGYAHGLKRKKAILLAERAIDEKMNVVWYTEVNK